MNRRCGFVKSSTLALAMITLTSGAFSESCLWKVSSKTGTLYLQGSVHVLKATHYPLAPAIEEAYAESESLVLEVDIKEMASPETQQTIMAMAMLPGSGTLRDALDEGTYQKLESACNEAGLPMVTLSKFKPWFATMTLTLVRLQQMGFDPRHGLDAYFYDRATADGKKVIGLEGIDFQIDLLDRLANENPDDFVARALDDLAIIEKNVTALEKAWESGDIDALGTLITKSFDGYSALHKTFVLDRNKRWLKILCGLLETSKTHMAVVGAGHLCGKGGLLELLKEKGYSLEQL